MAAPGSPTWLAGRSIVGVTDDTLAEARARLHRATSLALVVGLLAIAALSVGCATGSLPSATLPTAPPAVVETGPVDPPVGERQLVIEISNHDDQPATVLVGEDREFPDNVPVGNAVPNTLPAYSTVRVLFTVPATDDWAIFLNPGPEQGPVISAFELGDCVGFVPIKISVDFGGGSQVTAAPLPACMNPRRP